MRKLALVLTATLIAGAGAACGEPGGGGGAPGVNALAAAAEKAADAGSSRMTMTMEVDVSGQEMSMEGEGLFDYEEQLGEMTMTMTGDGLPGEQSFEMVIDERHLYVKVPRELGGGGWTRMDMTDVVGTRGATQFGQDPSQYLDFLRGAGDDVEEVGTEEIDGVTTTHYRARLSFDAILDYAADSGEASEKELEAMRQQLDALGDGSIPSEVWVDEDGLPRRMKLVMHVESGGQSMDMTVSIDLFDYGVDVVVEPPQRFEELPAPAG